MTEKLNFIMIETPMRGELLKDISFEDAHQKVNEDWKECMILISMNKLIFIMG